MMHPSNSLQCNLQEQIQIRSKMISEQHVQHSDAIIGPITGLTTIQSDLYSAPSSPLESKQELTLFFIKFGDQNTERQGDINGGAASQHCIVS